MNNALAFIQSALRRSKFMGIVNAFFDESGKFNDQKVVAFCGICATEEAMRKLDEDWRRLLRVNGLRSLTMKTALDAGRKISPTMPKQEFSERRKALEPFADCIREHVEMGVAIAIDVDAFKGLSPAAQKKMDKSRDPHYVAFLQGLVGVIEYAGDHSDVSFVCDDTEEKAWPCYEYYRRVQKVYPSARQKLAALTFADDEKFPGLQAADMLASLVRMEARRQFFRWRYDYGGLFAHLTAAKRGLKWAKCFWGKENIKELSLTMEKN